ncbi:MAG: bifunctional phosphoribosyl-AMP cyclohydrolase/phosphoribosyl-ATP diphosphatase HisIE [Candidatus Nezhaarchaeota archaeon]|nr:bifunctional phosphoribosyl-AMP cyclohydrolase/phosphoribosyl-ATP diphosphatase HisIE [Candidatus Nezhaarchaeota archaeon]
MGEDAVKLSLEEARKIAEKIGFSKLQGLVPAIAQDFDTGMVLMQAFMNEEALIKTLTTGLMHYWSRSKRRLWMKGEESGNVQVVKEVWADCDYDSLLFKVAQRGVGCHEGFYTCFHNQLASSSSAKPGAGLAILAEVFNVVKERVKKPRPGSYVCSLAQGGLESVIKKVSEECLELALAAKEGSRGGVVREAADLIFHCLVLLAVVGVEFSEVLDELRERRAARVAKA